MTGKYKVDLSKLNEDAYFELKEAWESYADFFPVSL